MFKLFKNKKKAKKEKEKQQKDANKENSTPTSPKTAAVAESSSPTDNNHNDKQNGVVEMRATNTTGVTPNQQQQLNVDCNLNTNESSCQASPSVFTESQNYDSHNHLHHYRSSHLSTLSAGAGDLNRILTSGYLTGDDDMGYLKRGVDLRVPKSPHFHRPDNFSYNNHHVNLIVASSNPYRKSSQLASMTGQIKKIRHSTSSSPKRVNLENEEPIRLSKFSGGYQPDPAQPAKIESLDWPSPPYPPAVPELRSRSRSSSHRKLNTSSRTATAADQIDSSMIVNGQLDDEDDHIPTKIHYTHKVYDDNYQDYTIRFRSRTTQPSSSRNSQQNQQSTSLPVSAAHQTVGVCDHEIDSLIQKDPKLKRDLEEMTKLENKSGMAKMFNIELKAQERLIQRALDPWKASRTPSASIEPHQKTRYETPYNASPSRVLCCCNKIHTTVYEDGQCSTCGGQQQPQHQHHSLSTNGGQTTPVSHLCSTPRKGGTMPKSAAPKPGYGLSSPKSTTLPNSTRYYGMTTHRSVDFDSNALTTGSYYAGETPIVSDKRKLSHHTNTYKENYIELRNAHSTRSTPNLTGLPPKIYPYSELKLGYKKKLPADVDRERLERHLATDELIRLFGVDTLEKFYELPEWKRVELKKKAKLF